MGQRLKLNTLLIDTLGNSNVYYSPPPSIKMKYPAIRYERNNISKKSANNESYMKHTSYQLTVIYYDPDFDVVDKIASLPKCKYTTEYTKDNLNHTIFTIEY